MSTIRIPVIMIGGKPNIPVTVSNPKTGKKVTLNMLLDTGWDVNRLEPKYASTLGYTNADITVPAASYNMYAGQITIGTLKPIETFLQINKQSQGLNVLGLLPMRQYDNFIITRTTAVITDSTTGGGTYAGLNALTKEFGKYEHTTGVPILAKKEALYANVRSNSNANWRNRL